MFYSGLIVTCKPDRFDAVGLELERLSVDIHQRHQQSGRYVVVLDEKTVEAETERFRTIRSLEGVADVSLVVHRDEPDAATA